MRRLLMAFCLLWPGLSEAARVGFTGFEWQSSAEVPNSAGTFSFDTTTFRSGAASLRTNITVTTGSGSGEVRGWSATGISAVLSVATTYTTFYFNYTTKASANDEPMFRSRNTSNALKLDLRLNSSGNLAAYDSTSTLMATGATVLSSGTWYRIEVKVGTGAAGAWEVKIDGTSEISGTGSLTTSNNGLLAFGKVANVNGNAVDYYYDDVWVDDAAYKGAHVVAMLLPNADGSTQQWVNGSGGAGTGNFEEVDEVPPSNADYVTSVNINDVGLFDLFDSSTQSISGTIHSVVALIRISEDAAGVSSVNLRLRANATNSDNSALDPGTTAATNGRYVDLDPSDAGAWTTADVDDIEVGAVDNDGVPVIRNIADALMVSFTAAAAGRRRVILVN
jgi:hypothetical protein